MQELADLLLDELDVAVVFLFYMAQFIEEMRFLLWVGDCLLPLLLLLYFLLLLLL